MHRFKYTIHNMIGHPIMEFFSIIGLHSWAKYVHDITLPKGWEEDYENSWDAGEETDH